MVMSHEISLLGTCRTNFVSQKVVPRTPAALVTNDSVQILWLVSHLSVLLLAYPLRTLHCWVTSATAHV